MSVHAGAIVLVAGNNVVDRVQSQGLGDVRLPIEVIREVGNEKVVDKVVGEPDFTFTLEAWDATTEIEAFLVGKLGAQASGSAPGASDPTGTEYRFEDMQGCVNIASPWKDAATGSAATVGGGHLIPGYYLTRLSYAFGVTDNSSQTAELAGGSFYYGLFAPREQQYVGNGATVAFATADPAVHSRIGGSTGTTFLSVFGVMVDGVLQIENVDYTVSGGAAAPGSTATVTFTVAPKNGADIRLAYFTSAAKSFPDAVHASTITKPGAVRGRNILVKVGTPGGTRSKVASIQSATLDATIDGTVEREFGNTDQIGRSVNGIDTNGALTIRSKDIAALFSLLKTVSGVNTDQEVVGWFNQNKSELEIIIQNPRDPGGTPLKTLFVDDAIFQIPGTPARVNTPTDFVINWESESGTFSAFKGAKP
jgi:hypothetical protein